MALIDQDYELIIQIVKQQSGIVLTKEKSYLLESRLVSVNEKYKFNDFTALASAMRMGNKDVIRDVVDALTTNESLFFRDLKPFDRFRDFMLPQLIQARAAQKTIRIWCAAASTGQEPYSLAILIKEAAAKLAGFKVEIIGTDLCREVLKRSQEGIYSQFEVQRGLPIQYLLKYFKQLSPDKWQINPDIRSMVTYREFNLLDNPTMLGRFDIVFCRNVLIYFDQETKASILERVSKQMPEDGYLILGGAETVIGITNCFELSPGERGIYKRTNAKSAPDILMKRADAAAAAASTAPAKAAAIPKVVHA